MKVRPAEESGNEVMNMLAVCLKLAEHWQRASRETTNDSLKACYAGRAAHYLEIAAREQARSQDDPYPR